MGDLIDRDELLKSIAMLTPKDTMRVVDWKRAAVWYWTQGDIYKLVQNFPAAKMEGDDT